MAEGTAVRFDEVKGYGFVTPEAGDDDVFIHVNDLLFDKRQLVLGQRVEFQLEEGDRGPKATHVRLVGPAPAAHPVRARSASSEAEAEEDMCDILLDHEYRHEITEALLLCHGLTGAQVLDIRARMSRIAEAHGWVERSSHDGQDAAAARAQRLAHPDPVAPSD